MATQIDARVKQKTGTEADFAGYTLLDGEIALVRTSANGPVFNFKVGPGNFDLLDWSLQTPGAPIAADTSTSFPSDLPGLYVPTEDGTYNGSVTVDMEDGYQVLVWDGFTLTKVVFPIDLSGYTTAIEGESLRNDINGITEESDNIYPNMVKIEGRYYSLTTGALINSAQNLSAGLNPAKPNTRYRVSGNGPNFSAVEFTEEGTYIRQILPITIINGGYEFVTSENAGRIGFNLANDGDMDKPVVITTLHVRTEAIPGFENLISMPTGSRFTSLDTDARTALDADMSTAILNKGDGTKSDMLGREKYVTPVGLNTSWTFDGSLALDQMTKSAELSANLISETYTTGSGYRINVGAVPSSGPLSFLRVDKPYSLNSLQYTREVLEFQLQGLVTGGRISILYAGETLYSRKLAHGFVFSPQHSSGFGVISIVEKTNINSGAWVSNNFLITSTVFNELDVCRLIHTFNGRTHTLEVQRLEGGEYVSKGSVSYSYGPCEQRPSNRKYAIEIVNIDVLITRYDTYSYEPYRVRLMFIGDSIQSGFSCTDFNNAYSRMGTKWDGIAGSVRSAHGCTTDDFTAMLPEILERRPEVVVLGLGLNDIRYNVTDYQTKYANIVTQLEAVGSKVILCNLIPNNVYDVSPFNEWLTDTFGDTNTIVDMYTPMEDPSNPGELNPAYHSDGTHPNDLGNAVMFETLKPYL